MCSIFLNIASKASTKTVRTNDHLQVVLRAHFLSSQKCFSQAANRFNSDGSCTRDRSNHPNPSPRVVHALHPLAVPSSAQTVVSRNDGECHLKKEKNNNTSTDTKERKRAKESNRTTRSAFRTSVMRIHLSVCNEKF